MSAKSLSPNVASNTQSFNTVQHCPAMLDDVATVFFFIIRLCHTYTWNKIQSSLARSQTCGIQMTSLEPMSPTPSGESREVGHKTS